MRSTLLEILASPSDHGELTVANTPRMDGDIVEGVLTASDGRTFAIHDSIPRMAPELEIADAQRDTRTTFAAKWQSITDSERDRLAEFQHRWFERRFGFADESALARELDGAHWVIDAGTGPGIQAARLASVSSAQVVAMDLSESVVRAHRTFAIGRDNLHYVQGDIPGSSVSPRLLRSGRCRPGPSPHAGLPSRLPVDGGARAAGRPTRCIRLPGQAVPARAGRREGPGDHHPDVNR